MHALEEKTRTLQSSRDEVTSQVTQQGHTIADLQTKNANLSIENETLRRKIEDMHQVRPSSQPTLTYCTCTNLYL